MAEAHADFIETRSMTHQLSDACADPMQRAHASLAARVMLAGQLPTPRFADWMTQRWLIDRDLDRHLRAPRHLHPALAMLAPDSRLHASAGEAALRALGVDVSAAQPVGATVRASERLASIAAADPIDLIGPHAARAALRSGDRYLAETAGPKLGVNEDALRLLNPHGIGQRPLWERFRRDFDKLEVSDDQRRAIFAAAAAFLDDIAAIGDEAAIELAAPAEHGTVLHSF